MDYASCYACLSFLLIFSIDLCSCGYLPGLYSMIRRVLFADLRDGDETTMVEPITVARDLTNAKCSVLLDHTMVASEPSPFDYTAATMRTVAAT